jgi:hypothetical protein
MPRAAFVEGAVAGAIGRQRPADADVELAQRRRAAV